MKHLWIMRHGEAEWQSTSDLDRELTSHGRAEVISVTKKLDLKAPFELWVSPYKRAKQTSDQFEGALEFKPENKVEEKMITPDSDPKLLAEYIEHHSANNIYIISHMPLVARLVQELTKDDRIGGFQTGQVVHCVQDDTGTWSLSAIYAPQVD